MNRPVGWCKSAREIKYSAAVRIKNSGAPASKLEVDLRFPWIFKVREKIRVYKKIRQPRTALDAKSASWWSNEVAVISLILPPESLVRLANSRFSSGFGKCRASCAFVEDYSGIDGFSGNTINFRYEKETLVFPEAWFDHRDVECSSGIHFFFRKIDATQYPL